jgi:pimeloyl-ACP methyl ester carboxylesterase
MPVELHTEAYGDGKPVVCLHGFGASTYTWRQLAPDLARDHHVVLIDLKGFGRSPKPRDAAYSVFDQSDLVGALIRRRGLRDVTLIGHSFGGGVALATALAAQGEPGLVTRLVLIDTMAYRQRLPWFLALLRAPIAGPAILWLTPPRVQVRIVLAHAFHDPRRITPDVVSTYAAGLASDGGRFAARQTARQLIPAHVDDFVSRYPSLRLPTLLVWGEHDRVVPRTVAARLADDLPDARLVIVPDAGHVPHEETPDAVIPIVKRFLAEDG